MGKFNRFGIFLLVLWAAIFGTAGCASDQSKAGEMSLKVGLMPAVDAAPFLLAEKNGYFTALGLQVELQIFNNAQDRQSALQTQAIDGAVTDLIAVAANVDGGFDIRATAMTNGVFPVLLKEGAEAKKNIKVGMMEVSVTNFLIDEWLGESYTIEKVYVSDIPARLAAIGGGQLDMGLFPEPMASMGELGGLIKKLYPSGDAFCPDVLVFTGKALKEKEEAIKRFHEAYDKGVAELNRDGNGARDILMEKIPNLKPEIRDKIILPAYTKAALPDDEYINKIIGWTSKVMNKGLTVKAGDLVERKFTNP